MPPDSVQRIGIYGGSFDPIHYGHLAIAEEARAGLALDQVLFIPAARQPFKGQAQSAAHHRLMMTRLACADHPAFVVDDLELQRPPPSYTADTLATLSARYGPTVHLWFILGADAAQALPRWHRLDQILTLARLAIVGRPGIALDLPSLYAHVPGLAGRTIQLEGPQLAIASSALRERFTSGLPVRYQLPEAVRAYIAAERLYAPVDDAPNE